MTRLILGILLILTQSCASQNRSLPSGIDLTQSTPDFENLLESEYDKNIYWLGEQHGTKENYLIALKFFKFLIKEVELDYILIENSYLTEIQLNKYLRTGNEHYLNKSIKNYSGTFYSNNQLRTYLKSIYNIYRELPENKKFQFVSIDIEQTYRASENYIHSFLRNHNLREEFKQTIDFDYEHDNHSRIEYYSLLEDFLAGKNTANDSIYYMVQNIKNILTVYIEGKSWDKLRDSLIFENFKIRDRSLDFKTKTSFAFWGTEHCYKSQNSKGVQWISSLISEHKPVIKQNSTVILYNKSEFMQHKSMFPKISRFLFRKIDENFISHRFQNEPFNKLRDKRFLKKHKMSDITMWSVMDINPEWNFITKKIKVKATREYLDNVILVIGSAHCTPYYGE